MEHSIWDSTAFNLVNIIHVDGLTLQRDIFQPRISSLRLCHTLRPEERVPIVLRSHGDLGTTPFKTPSMTSSPFPPVHFKEWYPFLGPSFAKKVEPGGLCAPQYQDYVSNTKPCTDGIIDCLAEEVVNCLLDNTTQTNLANQQAAAILLGLLPTVLGMAGSTTIEIGLLAFRRPLLAFLISMGSPCINPHRAFDYRNIVHRLGVQSDPTVKVSPRLTYYPALFVSALQYLCVCGSIANVGLITYDLSIKTVTTVALSATFLPALWVSTAVAIVFLGVVALILRVGLENKSGLPKQSWARKVLGEFVLESRKEHCRLFLKRETSTSIILSWMVATFIIAHLAYATLLLSSLLFIGTRDAAVIAVRLLLSTLVCRAILMYELSGLRERVTFEHKGFRLSNTSD